MDETLEKIDTSYWKTADQAWKAERAKKWDDIEVMVDNVIEYKKNLNVVKAYYLRGKMPDWKSLQNANNPSTHLDLFMFLWLHPSWDEAKLKDLRGLYMSSDLIVYDDVAEGFNNFFSSQELAPTWQYESKEEIVYYPYVDGYGELLFKVMMGEADATEYELPKYSDLGRTRTYTLPKQRFESLCSMGAWFDVEIMYRYNEAFLYQYDLPLKWWFEKMRDSGCTSLIGLHEDAIYSYQKALYQIHTFDIEKEGDTCRSRFAHKIRSLLDTMQFEPDFNETWESIKKGELIPQDPWED